MYFLYTYDHYIYFSSQIGLKAAYVGCEEIEIEGYRECVHVTRVVFLKPTVAIHAGKKNTPGQTDWHRGG